MRALMPMMPPRPRLACALLPPSLLGAAVGVGVAGVVHPQEEVGAGAGAGAGGRQ